MRWLPPVALAALSLGACDASDADGDGFLSTLDCNDDDAAIAPDRVEVCNGVDDDCDGEVDEDLARFWYHDQDHDGIGADADPVVTCDRPPDTVSAPGDCDDTRATARPGAPEICNGADDDCDGEVDEDLSVTWYADNDRDGIGGEALSGCELPDGAVATVPGDCDDDDATISPAAAEVCDGVDQDCDGQTDEGVGVPYWSDTDGDQYGDVFGAPTYACGGDEPAGMVQNASDCDDLDANTFIGAPELCDAADNDCDGTVDENAAFRYFLDTDGDGFGDPASVIDACELPAGYATNPFDCDDSQALAWSGAVESCDGVDNDCDGSVDEDVLLVWFVDGDGDGWGDKSAPVEGCEPPADAVFVGRDCDDSRADVGPLGVETCDGVDQDCDGMVDEGAAITWWVDADGDGWGDPTQTDSGCTVPNGTALQAGDCDDSRADASPDGVEVCDQVDQDCDGIADDGVAALYWTDGDLDGVGSTNAGVVRACAAPAGTSPVAGDCDDADGAVGSGCAPVLTGAWTTFGGDAGRTGHAPGFVTGGLATEAWTVTDPARTWLGPVVSNGAVIGTANGGSDTVSSWDLGSGTPLWTYTLQPSVNPTAPTVADGLVLVERINAGDAYVLAIDEALGTQQWRATVTAGADRYRAPLASDGRVFAVGGLTGGVYGIDASTGGVDWIAPGAVQLDDWTPVWGDGAVWTQVDDTLNEIDPATGGYVGSIALPSGPVVAGVMGTVPAVEGTFALVIAGTDLVGVDLAAGAVVWTVSGGFSGSPTIADGLGYAIRNGFAQQFDLSDGYLVQEYAGDGLATGKVIVTDDAVIVGSPAAVHVLQLWDGALVDLLPVGGEIVAGEGSLVIHAAGVLRAYTW